MPDLLNTILQPASTLIRDAGDAIVKFPSRLTVADAVPLVVWFKSIIPPLPIIFPFTVCVTLLEERAPKENLLEFTITSPPISTLAATLVIMALNEVDALLMVRLFSHSF